jgi:hypothetical protein
MRSAVEWRAGLTGNHGSAAQAWLVIYGRTHSLGPQARPHAAVNGLPRSRFQRRGLLPTRSREPDLGTSWLATRPSSATRSRRRA